LPIRDSITPAEFRRILDIARTIFSDPSVAARVVVTLTLLYLTGLRISNLLVFSRRNLEQLFHDGETTVRIIKRGPDRKLLWIGTAGRALLQEIEHEVNLLLQKQPNSDGLAFASRKDTTKPLNRFNFTKQCNDVLEKASEDLGKHLRSHSFRASFVTDLLDSGVSIETTKDIIGHRDIGTTVRYPLCLQRAKGWQLASKTLATDYFD
jgi:site-specific recombinase XerD